VPGPRPTAERQAKQPKSGDSYSQANGAPTPQHQAVIDQRPTANLQAIASDSGKDGNKEEQGYRLTDILLIAFNGLLAAFTLALVIIGGLQARRLRQTVEATKDAADAAKKSAKVAEQSLSVSNRPLLAFQSPTLNNFAPMPVVGQVNLIFASYEFYNYGAGLAWIVETCVLFEVMPAGEMPDPPVYKERSIERPSIAVPFRERVLGSRPLKPAAMLAEIDYRAIAVDRSSYLAIWGYVRYLDMLNRRWKMGFCWVYEPPDGFNIYGYWKVSGPDSYHYNIQEED